MTLSAIRVERTHPRLRTAGRFQFVSILALLVLTASICLMRLHYYDWPPNRDVSTYATIGHELLNGEALYSGVWDMKPPAVYATFALGETVFGYGPRTIYMLNLTCAVIVLAGLYRAGIASGLGAAAGLWSALSWAIVSGDLRLQMHDPNTEAFINASVIWAFVLLLSSGAHRPYLRAAGAGILIALASLYKPVVVAIAASLSLALLVFPTFSRNWRRTALGQIAIIVSIGLLSWIVVSGFFVATGRGEIFYETMVTFNREYSGDLWENLKDAITLKPVLESYGVVRMAIWGTLLAIAIWFFRLGLRRSRRWGLLLAYALGAQVAVAIPGKYYAHYFQLLLPVFALALGWVTVAASDRLGGFGSRWRWAPQALAVIALLLLARHEWRYFQASAEQQLPGSYAELYLASQELGKRVEGVLEPDEDLFQWGQEAGIYFSSRRRPPSHILCHSLVTGPLTQRFTERTLWDLGSKQPELVVAARWFVKWSPEHPVLDWVEDHYRAIEGTHERTNRFFILMVRRGGTLDARLEGSGKIALPL